ncbi:MAG: Na(+)-translocating NADH-quinone reductase subunit A [Planctomycetota bacterium]
MAKRFNLDRGLDLPLAGEPAQTLPAHGSGPIIRSVGLVGDDYVGMKPTMEVAVGDRVKLGQVLFTDKKTEGVKYTSPGAGTVSAVNRGAKRKFESVVVELDGDEAVAFTAHRNTNLSQLPRETVQRQLVDSGLWTTLRTRPFTKVPTPGTTPYAVFVTAIDTSPLAPDPAVVVAGAPADFEAGLQVLTTLTDGTTWLCTKAGAELPGEDLPGVEVAEFAGPHPAGLPGTHMHHLAPVSLDRQCWSVGYQDVLAIGRLFLTGELDVGRVVSVAGPVVNEPQLVRTRVGASLADLTANSGAATNGVRTISGSVFGGRTSEAMREHLGRLHNQVTQLIEGTQRDFIGWMGPGFGKFSITNVFAAKWPPPKFVTDLLAFLPQPQEKFPLTTSTEGSHRAIVPLGNYEKVMPLDLVPTPLLKSIVVGDTDELQRLGGLELDEDDLGLCSFVCASKNDYGPMLRECLTSIERDG